MMYLFEVHIEYSYKSSEVVQIKAKSVAGMFNQLSRTRYADKIESASNVLWKREPYSVWGTK